MKIIYFSILFLTIHKLLFATNYYISNSGDDNSSGKSINETWATIDKVNASMAMFSAGDSILFKRGDTFRGTLEVKASGTSSKPIVFGAYGTGNKPVIKASKVITGWTKDGNIWSADCPDCPDRITNLFIDDEFMPLGRYPNNNYLTITAAEGKTVIVDKNLNFPDGYWNKSYVAIRTVSYVIDAVPVLSQTGTRITLEKITSYGIHEGYGYFFQNHINTLDFFGEWAYDKSQKKVHVYSTTDINKKLVEITYYANCINLQYSNYVFIINLELTHSRSISIQGQNSNNIYIESNTISFSGGNGVELTSCDNISFKKNIIINTNNNGFKAVRCNNGIFSNNLIKNTALHPGRGYNASGNYLAVFINQGNTFNVENNIIDSVGFNGIEFIHSENTLIKNNFINYPCIVLDDGAGIYTWQTRMNGNRIVRNIVLHSFGNNKGTDRKEANPAHGIYIDGGSSNIDILDNTIAYSNMGIYISHSQFINIKNNTCFDNKYGIYFWSGLESLDRVDNSFVKGNHIFALGRYKQWVISFKGLSGNISFENNVLCDPYDIDIIREFIDGKEEFFSVEQWQQKGHESDRPIPLRFSESGLSDTTGFVIFNYNPTNTTKTKDLYGTYRDLNNNLVSGSIEIAPYSSIILLKEYRSVLGTETTPKGPLEFCQGTQSSEYTTTGDPEASTYSWQLSPTSAGTISGNGKSISVNWNPDFSGNCNISFLASGANSFKAVSPALQVNVLPKPVKPTLPEGPEKLFQNAPLTDYSTTGISDALSYEWKLFPPEAGEIYPNETSCKVEWNEPFLGYAYLSVRAENGCGLGKYSDSLRINVQEAELAYGIINIFTPNGDGFNDYWSIPFIKDFPDAVIKIFDRNNQLLIEYKGADSSWNGTVNGELVPMGNYLYVIDLKNGKPPIKGYVTVLR